MPDITKIIQLFSQKARCLSCGANINIEKLQFISENDFYDQFWVECGICGSTYIYALHFCEHGISMAGTRTDLTYEDALKFDKKEPISADELLDFHLTLDKVKSLI